VPGKLLIRLTQELKIVNSLHIILSQTYDFKKKKNLSDV